MNGRARHGALACGASPQGPAEDCVRVRSRTLGGGTARFGLALLMLPLLAALGACTGRRGSQLDAHWTGADTGRLVTSAGAEWCAVGKYLRIEALRGDTGVAIAIFPADTVLPGRYQFAATLDDSSRPAAAVVLRWLDALALAGF